MGGGGGGDCRSERGWEVVVVVRRRGGCWRRGGGGGGGVNPYFPIIYTSMKHLMFAVLFRFDDQKNNVLLTTKLTTYYKVKIERERERERGLCS